MNAAALPNPLIPGFNPDPSCVRVGDEYIAVTSTFEYLPALPVYRSTDLVTWEHVGDVAADDDRVGLAGCASGTGTWAPTIRHHDGRFYVIVSIAGSPRGCVVFTAADPAGPWDAGVSIDGVDGIDPDVAWDHDGTAYVTWSGLHLSGPLAGTHDGIVQARADLVGGRLLEEPRRLWSGTGLTAPEAPHLYHRDGTWYLVIAEGGTGRGHAVSVARGDRITGPFTGAPANPVLTAAGSDRPVVCTGHADLVTAPDGTDVILLLGTRPVDGAGSYSVLGRETFVTPVDWVDGWPVPQPVRLAPREEPVEELFPLSGDDPFAGAGWLGVRRPPSAVAHASGPDGVVLRGTGLGLREDQPVFAGRRQRHIECTVSVVVEALGGEGGIALRFHEEATITLLVAGSPGGLGTVTARADIASIAQTAAVEVPAGPVALEIATRRPRPAWTPWAQGADEITLSAVDAAGRRHELMRLDGRYWAVETAAPFTGRVLGVLAQDGDVLLRDFRYHGAGGS